MTEFKQMTFWQKLGHTHKFDPLDKSVIIKCITCTREKLKKTPLDNLGDSIYNALLIFIIGASFPFLLIDTENIFETNWEYISILLQIVLYVIPIIFIILGIKLIIPQMYFFNAITESKIKHLIINLKVDIVLGAILLAFGLVMITFAHEFLSSTLPLLEKDIIDNTISFL